MTSVAAPSARHPVRHPIWAKVTGITVVLLLLMGFVTYSSSANLKRLSRELALLSHYDIPLDQAVSDVRYDNLVQMLLFERIVALDPTHDLTPAQQAGDAAAAKLKSCDRAEVAAASKALRERFTDEAESYIAMYAVQGHCADMRLAVSQRLVDQALAAPNVANDIDLVRKFTRLQTQLAALPQARANLLEVTSTYLGAVQRGEAKSVSVLKAQLDANRRLVGLQAADISHALHEYTQGAAAEADQLEQNAFWLNWGITAGAALLGFLLASALTRNLVRPVRELLSGAQAIESGDLNIRVHVKSADEIALLAHSFNYMVAGLKEKESIKETFGKYVDPRIVATVLDSSSLAQQGEKRVMTVFFSDIEGFTSLCEQITPENVVRLLNHYFTTMSEPIAEQRGIIDKYIGDAIMAFWGPPFTTERDHAVLACKAALEQVERLDAFRQTLPDITGLRRGLPHFNMRMGICTGDVTVGTIGSSNTKNYTVIGDTVNLAARLEAANKYYGTRLIISDATYALAQDALEVRMLDRVRVMGKSEPVQIYELLGLAGQVSETRLALRTTFERGLAAYRRREWDAARGEFEACLQLEPEDGPAKVFIARLDRFAVQAPADGWDGIWNLEAK
ncbi:MAG: HAMP domain-containing protein [Burkholderiales bacterium]|nr:HAMP domain-containing protein [Burkholderiales bacterium]